jgi:hypothetical protein
MLLTLAVVAALAPIACGGDNDKSTSSQSQNAQTTKTTGTTGTTGKKQARKKGSAKRKSSSNATQGKSPASSQRAKLREQRRTLRNILKGAKNAPPEPGENLPTKKAKTSFAYARALIICSGEGLTKLAHDLKVKRDPQAVAKKYAEKSGSPKDVAIRGCLAGLKRSAKK